MKSLSVLLLLVSAGAAAPAVLGATDLVNAWQAAQQHNPGFAAARAQWEAGLTRKRQGRALSLPQVTASAAGGYIETDRNTTGAQFNAPGFGASNDATFRTHIDGGSTTTWAISAQQSLYSAERLANSRQLDRQSQLAEEQFRSAQQDLILQTAQAYFAVLLAEESLATLQAQKDAAARALDVAMERFDAGAAPVTDRDEAQARFDAIVTDELLARDELQLKRAAFADLTGLASERLKRVSADTSFDQFNSSPLSAWTERASRRNPLIAMQDLGRDIARDELDKFRALMAPSLDLVARVADDRMNGGNGFGGTTHLNANTRTVGVQVTIPLYSGGMRDAKRDEAAALVRKSEFDAQALRQEVLRQTQASWLGVSTGISRVKAQTQALRSARSRLNATETGREVGERTTLDLMNAQTDFYQAQRNLAQVKYQLLLDRLRLAAVAGDLTDAELREVNAVLAHVDAPASK
ncbi:MAG: TolC family outer membrane protein [Betaproteobacteria bacterium]